MTELRENVGGLLPFGGHYHKKNSKCVQCEMENKAFMDMQKEGAMKLEQRISKLPSAKAYYQRWPYDGWKTMDSFEGVFAENGESIFGTTASSEPLYELIDTESTDELLEGLDEREQHIMRRTAEGYKPKEIAAELGHKNSNMVRLGKYEAKRALGVPVNEKMRRTK